MLFVGLDVHARRTSVCILDDNGKKLKAFDVRGDATKIAQSLSELKQPFQVCYEASCGFGHYYDLLRPIAQRVVVAHPGQVRLIFRAKRKNDRIDAQKLAKLLFLDEVPPVYVPSLDVRSWRRLIEFRISLVSKRTQIKNELRSLLRNYGWAAPHKGELWTKAGITWLEELDLPTDDACLQRDIGLEELASIMKRIRRVERRLNEIARQHPGIALLCTIPGVGPRTAEAVLAYIDNPDRFTRSNQVGCYFGLVPCQDQSGSSNRLGHITREGPGTVRRFLTEASWQAIRKSPTIRAYFERIVGGDRDRRKIAVIATAHYLVRVMFSMLRSGEVWRESEVRHAA